MLLISNLHTDLQPNFIISILPMKKSCAETLRNCPKVAHIVNGKLGFEQSQSISKAPPPFFFLLYMTELSQDFLDDNLGQFAYDNHVSTPLVTMTITRLVVGFLLPFIVMVACYSLIIFRMRRSRFTKSRSKTFRVAIVVMVVFLVCWAPYHIFGVLLLFIDPETTFGEAMLSWDHVALALASANSCFNPFLYAFMGKGFRKKARRSMQGILETAFSEDLKHSTSCTSNKVFSETNSSRAV